MARSISFIVAGPVETRVTITETNDGGLLFELDVADGGTIGDLRGLFFDLNDPITAEPIDFSSLGITGLDGTDIDGSAFDEGGVDNLGKGNNIRGAVANDLGLFDGGVAFGQSGIGRGRSDIQEASFLLTSDDRALSLDLFDVSDIALRFTSVGDANGRRDDSAKIGDQTAGVARNDAFLVLENASGSVDLLANDTNGDQNTVTAVADENGGFDVVPGGFERTIVLDGLVLGTLSISAGGVASFVADGADVDQLAHDALPSFEFSYTTTNSDGTSFSTAGVVLTVDGVNDTPVAEDIALVVDEDAGSAEVQNPQFEVLTGPGITAAFDASDIDIGDLLTYQILSDPTDATGNQYGSVTNNDDGTFTFDPGDEFQFLDAGESRTVSFQYVAIDDSGVGTTPDAPEETDTSLPATISVTVTGSDDAPVSFTDNLLFETEDQSQFGTGEAIIIEEQPGFIGFDTGTINLGATLFGGQTVSGDVLEDILGSIEAVAQVFADLGCSLVDLFGGDCDADVSLPSSITVPSAATFGSLALKAGLLPFLFLNSGEVDAEVPVTVDFLYPRQVEANDTFIVESDFDILGAEFDTASPSVQFGIDVVFDFDLDFGFSIGDLNVPLIDVDTGMIDGFVGELGEPGFNLFNFDTRDGEGFEIADPTGILTLEVETPFIETTGTQVAPGAPVLTSEGEDDVAIATLDIDAIVAEIVGAATGVPLTFQLEGSEGLAVDVAGVSLDLLSVAYNLELLDLDFITTLQAAQDFTLEIEDLPLLATLEDGSIIDGFSLGDEISITAPGSGFDADLDGNADGLIDVDVDVDIEALFSNNTGLELDLDLFAGLFRFDAGLTSDILPVEAFNVSLADLIDTGFNSDGFLFAETQPLAEDLRIATLFDETFDLEGFNTEATGFAFDVA